MLKLSLRRYDIYQHEAISAPDIINVEITPDAEIVFSEFDNGDKVSDLFQIIHIDAAQLQQCYQRLISATVMDSKRQRECEQQLINGLDGYTSYLED